jgi:hypothetical protein
MPFSTGVATEFGSFKAAVEKQFTEVAKEIGALKASTKERNSDPSGYPSSPCARLS